MRYSIFDTSDFFLPRNPQYDAMLSKRNIIDGVRLKRTKVLLDPLRYDPDEIQIVRRKWTTHTKMFRLAQEFYGDAKFYWVIGLFNKKPTDAHWNVGDTIFIPEPLEAAVELLGY